MSKSKHNDIRKLLRANPDGLTVNEISYCSGISVDTIRDSLKSMPDTYIDRYGPPARGQYVPVWCTVEVPEDCPHPTKGVVK